MAITIQRIITLLADLAASWPFRHAFLQEWPTPQDRSPAITHRTPTRPRPRDDPIAPCRIVAPGRAPTASRTARGPPGDGHRPQTSGDTAGTSPGRTPPTIDPSNPHH